MKNKIITISFVFYLAFFTIFNIITPDKDVSTEERRTLAQFPKVTANFMNDFDNYALDQFIFRSEFRSLKSYYNLNVLNMNDVNDFTVKDNTIYKLDYKLNDKSVNNFINIINEINEKYFHDNKSYYAIIPDKSYFLDDSYLKYDYNYLFDKLGSSLKDITNIDLLSTLTINDYYKTDTHWRQEKLIKVIDKLLTAMNVEFNSDYQVNTLNDFYGVYYGQLGLKLPAEELNYLTSSDISNCEVWYLEDKESKNVYTLNKKNSMDLYDTFLNGSQSLIKIENKNALSDKKLVVFRDSFGSSLIPLLISSYKEIIVIDLRYINMDSVTTYVDIADYDVLYLYSTLIVNNSFSLKK